MAILGVTHDEQGNPLQRLAISRKVSIGLPAGEGGRRAPQKLDHFRITVKDATGNWIEDEELREQIEENRKPKEKGKPLRSIDIILLSDDIEEAFPTQRAWWSASEKRCYGDGKTAYRSSNAIPGADKEFPGQRWIPWPNCGPECPEVKNGHCKPSGRLHFMLPERPVLGSVCIYNTTSYQTVGNIFSSLLQIKDIAKGRLKGILLKMVLSSGKTTYKDKGGKPHSSNAFFVNIDFISDDHKRLISSLVEESLLYEKSILLQEKKVAGLIGPKKVAYTEVEELPEQEEAQILHPEFYTKGEEEAAPQDPTDDFHEDFNEHCDRLKLSKVKRDMLLAQYAGEDLDSLLRFLSKFTEYCDKLKPKKGQMNSWLDKGAANPAWLWEYLDSEIEAKKKKPPEEKPPEEKTEAAPLDPRQAKLAELEAIKNNPLAKTIQGQDGNSLFEYITNLVTTDLNEADLDVILKRAKEVVEAHTPKTEEPPAEPPAATAPEEEAPQAKKNPWEF